MILTLRRHQHLLNQSYLSQILYMYLVAKSGGHRCYRNGDINFYINSYTDTLSHRLDSPYCEIFKIRNTDLHYQNPG